MTIVKKLLLSLAATGFMLTAVPAMGANNGNGSVTPRTTPTTATPMPTPLPASSDTHTRAIPKDQNESDEMQQALQAADLEIDTALNAYCETDATDTSTLRLAFFDILGQNRDILKKALYQFKKGLLDLLNKKKKSRTEAIRIPEATQHIVEGIQICQNILIQHLSKEAIDSALDRFCCNQTSNNPQSTLETAFSDIAYRLNINVIEMRPDAALAYKEDLQKYLKEKESDYKQAQQHDLLSNYTTHLAGIKICLAMLDNGPAKKATERSDLEARSDDSESEEAQPTIPGWSVPLYAACAGAFAWLTHGMVNTDIAAGNTGSALGYAALGLAITCTLAYKPFEYGCNKWDDRSKKSNYFKSLAGLVLGFGTAGFAAWNVGKAVEAHTYMGS